MLYVVVVLAEYFKANSRHNFIPTYLTCISKNYFLYNHNVIIFKKINNPLVSSKTQPYSNLLDYLKSCFVLISFLESEPTQGLCITFG